MKKWLNYFGQLRIYSLADLIELLLVACAAGRPLWGAVVLHIGFLAFLESQHRHTDFREPVPDVLPWVLFMYGREMFGPNLCGTYYIFFALLYTLKKQGWWGLVSPFARGAQTFALLYPFAAGRSHFLLVAAIAMATSALKKYT